MLRTMPKWLLLLGGLLVVTPVGAQEEKKEKTPPKKAAPTPLDLPNFDDLFKGLPLEPMQAEELQKLMKKVMEDYRKALEKGGFPGGGLPGFPGGGLPGFPGGGLPLPGGGLPGGGLPGGGFPFPGFPGMPGKLDLKPGRAGADGRLGIQVERPSDVLADHLGLLEGFGLVVVSVRPDSPAGKAGIKPKDIIMEWGGKEVPSDAAAFKDLVDKTGKAPIEVQVIRKGKLETIKNVTLPERRVDPVRPRPKFEVRGARVGALALR
jgi:hypothetical protein